MCGTVNSKDYCGKRDALSLVRVQTILCGTAPSPAKPFLCHGTAVKKSLLELYSVLKS